MAALLAMDATLRPFLKQERRSKMNFRSSMLPTVIASLAISVVALLGAAQSARAQTLETQYDFSSLTNGGFPLAGLVSDGKGDFYGTTQGFVGEYCVDLGYCGTVYKFTPPTLTTLYSFEEKKGVAKEGANPGYGTLALDSSGNLYGTTQNGGAYGYGTIFKLTSAGKLTVLHSFNGGDGGATPYGGVLMIGSTLYGTTFAGGSSGNGIAFSLAGTKFSVLHTFAGGTKDGAAPYSGVTAGTGGDLYGTASAGGANGFGIVYKLTTAGKYSVLYSFKGGTDGEQPRGGLILQSGSLYGTTYQGGQNSFGTIFEVNVSTGAEKVLFDDFITDPPNENPWAGLVSDASGNLYGTTYGLEGSVFKLDTENQITNYVTLSPSDGEEPTGVLILDSSGNLWGTTSEGGSGGAGTIFKLIP
jgi:uncharacterized repeat protein (TIGR03803 family)